MKYTQKIVSGLTGGIIGLSLVAAPAYADSSKTIVGNATGDEYGELFTTLVAAVSAADLVETLNGTAEYTVLAPTNDAFAALPDGTVESLLLPENKDILIDILLYHVIPGTVLSTDLSDGLMPTAANGDTLNVSISGDTVMFNDATVIAADVLASNGVIHAIDTVLLPPADETAETSTALPTIVDIAVNNGFTSLVDAVVSQGLDGTLANDGPFTVFAPTNEAFAKLPTYVTKALERDPALLSDILLYHVVPGTIASTDLKRFQKVDSLEGSQIYARSLPTGVKINKADVVLADIEASNGIVHVIDEVLIPRSFIKDELKRVQSELREILKALRSR